LIADKLHRYRAAQRPLLA